MEYSAEKYIDRPVEIPLKYQSSTNKLTHQFSIWKHINGIIRNWIYGFMSSEVFGYLISATTTYDMWHTYEKMFISSAQSRVIELKPQ